MDNPEPVKTLDNEKWQVTPDDRTIDRLKAKLSHTTFYMPILHGVDRVPRCQADLLIYHKYLELKRT
jgi:hypothetical protein